MKPQDLFKQLVGEITGWDQSSDFAFVFYGCEKFAGKSVNIDIESGTLEVLNDEGGVDEVHAIRATLEPITP